MDRGSVASQHWVARVNIGRTNVFASFGTMETGSRVWCTCGVSLMQTIIRTCLKDYLLEMLNLNLKMHLASYLSQSSVEGSQMLLRQMFSCHSGFLWQVIRALEWLTNNIFPPGCESIVVPHVCHQVFPWVSLCNRFSAARPSLTSITLPLYSSAVQPVEPVELVGLLLFTCKPREQFSEILDKETSESWLIESFPSWHITAILMSPMSNDNNDCNKSDYVLESKIK